MGEFWEEFQTTNGLEFVGKEEKAQLIADAIVLPVIRVFRAESQFGPQFIVVTSIDGEERAVGFAAEKVDSRDQMLEAMARYLEREDAVPPNVVLEVHGRSVILVQAPVA